MQYEFIWEREDTSFNLKTKLFSFILLIAVGITSITSSNEVGNICNAIPIVDAMGQIGGNRWGTLTVLDETIPESVKPSSMEVTLNTEIMRNSAQVFTDIAKLVNNTIATANRTFVRRPVAESTIPRSLVDEVSLSINETKTLDTVEAQTIPAPVTVTEPVVTPLEIANFSTETTVTQTNIDYTAPNFNDLTRPSNLSGDELNEVMRRAIIKDGGVPENSILYGKGDIIYTMERKYQINGLLLLATSCTESGYGRAQEAKDNNNPFGMMISGSGNILQTFPSVEAGIESYAHLMRNYYLDAGLVTVPKIMTRYCNGNWAWVNKVSNIMVGYNNRYNEMKKA